MEKSNVLAALGQIARIVSETLELKEVIARVAKTVATVLPMDRMAITRLEETGKLSLYSISEPQPAEVIEVSLLDFSPKFRPVLDRVVRFADLQEIFDPAFLVDRELCAQGIRSVIGAPLRQGEKTVGLVSADSRKPGAFTAAHELVFGMIAELVGLALEHERLWNLDLTRRRRLDAIDALLPVIASALDVREIFLEVSAVVKPVLPHDHLLLMSASPDRQIIHIEAFAGEPIEDLPHSIPVAEFLDRPVEGGQQLISGVQAGPKASRVLSGVAGLFGARSILCCPIRVEGTLGSTLHFLSRTAGRYSEDDVEVSRRVADHVSLALSHSRLAEEERRVALLEQRVEALSEQLEASLGLRLVIGQSAKWKAVLADVAKVAPTETTVLLTGESGTGKEVLARMIHRGSPRAQGPFVAINCAALPETLLESELFGHEKGAFTGATATHLGCIEQAAGGVLFLDEVGEMSPSLQAKLLRVLEQREFQRVGGDRLIQANVRVIAATNRNLQAALARGDFREDLYYRLHVFEIAAPPLRERPEDILLLADAFLDEIGRRVGRPAGGFSQEVHAALVAYPWPGNARELRNVIERATILCDEGLITLDHLPAEVRQQGQRLVQPEVPFPEGGVKLQSLERDLIQKALRQAQNNRSQAARLLGITRSALYYKMQKHGLDPKAHR